MTLLLIFLIVVGAAYALLMWVYRIGWAMVPEVVAEVEWEPRTRVSVIVPARNEAGRITPCLEALAKQNYPRHLVEVIVVDDHSEDDTMQIVKSFADRGIKYVSLKDTLQGVVPVSYKKAALSCGIQHSCGHLIVTTDADCTAGAGWLRELAFCYEQQKPQMIIAPVMFQCDDSILQRFQLIDFMSMQGITFAAQRLGLGRMCNGANLAFSRKVFDAVGGYEGVDHFVSGDDYLLMMKIAADKGNRIVTLKSTSAIVRTPPQQTWADFLSQRVRWASKSGKYPDIRLTLILLLVYVYNLSFLIAMVMGFADHRFWFAALALLVIKVIFEYAYLLPVARFFRVKGYAAYLVLLQPLHILYIISAGFLGYAGGFEWKGRKVRQ